MSGIINKIASLGHKLADPAKILGFDATKQIGDTVGQVFGFNKQADAITDAAQTQADATKSAADAAAKQASDAAAAQTAQIQQNQAASTAALQATVNQNATAAQIAATTPPPEKAASVDLSGSDGTDANDPRRKYNSGGSASIGGSSGGVGIKLS